MLVGETLRWLRYGLDDLVGDGDQHLGGTRAGIEDEEILSGHDQGAVVGAKRQPQRRLRQRKRLLRVVGAGQVDQCETVGRRAGRGNVAVVRHQQPVSVGRDRNRVRLRHHIERSLDGLLGQRHHFDAIGREIGDVEHAPWLIERDVGSVASNRHHFSKCSRHGRIARQKRAQGRQQTKLSKHTDSISSENRLLSRLPRPTQSE